MNTQIELTEFSCKVKLFTDKNPKRNKNILASASVSFNGPSVEYLTITGFTVWKSKYKGLNVTVPQKNFPSFKYLLVEKTLWKKIFSEILNKYEYAVVADDLKNNPK